MPGTGGFGTESIGGFYPYLLTDVAILLGVLCVVWTVATVRRQWGAAPLEAAVPAPPEAVPQPPARTLLLRALGVLWIAAGLLQAQPTMPAGFAHNVLAPAAQGVPGWLANLLNWEIYFWQAHPLDLAVAAVLVQVGLGVMILAGNGSALGRAGLWLSIGWSLLVWVGGEAMGGLLAPGASEIKGSPGPVLVYAAAAVLLLAPTRFWAGGKAARQIPRGVGLLLLAGAALQALPQEGLWTGPRLSAIFRVLASVPKPGFLSAPMLAMESLSRAHPIAVNAALVGAMAILGAGLLWGRAPRRWLTATLTWLALTWWVGQGFGALASRTPTNLGLAPLLGLLLVCAWRSEEPAAATAAEAQPLRASRSRHLALGGTAAIVVGLVPVLLGLPVAAAQSSTIAALSAGGPVTSMGNRSLPNLSLVNQDGDRVDLRQWPNKAMVITFLDPVCIDDCPIIAEQLASADRALGALAKRVEFVAVVANPIYRSLSEVRSFDSEMELSDLPNWQYLTGSLPQLETTWSDFDVSIELPRLQMVDHPLLLYFVKPGGQEVSLTQDAAFSQASLITSYISLIDQQLRALVGQ